MPVVVQNLNSDQVFVSEPNVPKYIDSFGDAAVSSPDGVINIQVAMWADGTTQADPEHDLLGIDPASGITLTNGLNVGSKVIFDGVVGEIGPGSSGTYNFHIMFEHDALAPASAVESLIRALTYTTTGLIPDHFSRKIFIAISPDTGDASMNFITVMKEPWPGGGGGNPGQGGANSPPVIGVGLPYSEISEWANPFAITTITDPDNDNLSLTVKVSDPSKGSFQASSLGGGSYDAVSGTYTVSGAPAHVQAALQGLVFVPNGAPEGAKASSASLTFEINVSDGRASTFAVYAADVWANRADILKGTSCSDKLYGYSGTDKLIGNAGNDKLFGGYGNDTLTGGAGKDVFVFDTKPNTKTGKDKITDFKVKDDSIWLDNAVFTKLGKSGTEAKPAQLKSAYFTIGSKAKDKNDYIIYDNKKGVLYYDADGSGKGKAVEIASISKNLEMTHKDFFVI